MLRTNNKQVKAYFDNLLDEMVIDFFENDINNVQIQLVASATDGKGFLCYKTFQEAFETITFNYGPCYYDDMRNELKEALQETTLEANKHSNDKVASLYNYLLYMAYLRAIDKAGFSINKGFKIRY